MMRPMGWLVLLALALLALRPVALELLQVPQDPRRMEIVSYAKDAQAAGVHCLVISHCEAASLAATAYDIAPAQPLLVALGLMLIPFASSLPAARGWAASVQVPPPRPSV